MVSLQGPAGDLPIQKGRNSVTKLTTSLLSGNAFVRLTIATTVIEFVVAEAGSYLLAKGLYLPLQIGVPISALMIPLILYIPETMTRSNPIKMEHLEHMEQEGEPLLNSSRSSTNSQRPDIRTGSTRPRFAFHLLNNLEVVRNLWSSIIRSFSTHSKIYFVLLAFFVGVLDRGTFGHVLQYLSKKFDWTFAEAGKLVPVSSAFHLAGLVYVVPNATKFLRERHPLRSTQNIDSIIVTASLLAIAVGNVVIALCSVWQEFVIGTFYFKIPMPPLQPAPR